jgi:spore germination protein YaaH
MPVFKRSLSLCIALFIAFVPALNAGAADYKFNMSYIYFGNSTGYTKLVDAAQKSLSEVAPNYFSLDADGKLVLTNAVSQEFIDSMHHRGIDVVPYLTNDWDRAVGISALNNMTALSDALAAAIERYDLDGVNVDLENLTEQQRAGYVAFVRLLREKLPPGKKIAVAVAANPYGHTTGWQGSYDYAGLASHSDYLMLMAYDESWYGSKPGPVASYSFIEKSVRYALGLVPKEKLVLGLPFYGRIWSDSGAYPKGYGISNTRVEQYIAKYNGRITVDSVSCSAKAVITIKDSDTKPIVGGKELPAGTYTVWYENEETLKAKLALVRQYDLYGAGSWSLGQETGLTWDYYKLWLNGCTFVDIQKSWAKDYILHAYINSWVQGITPESFAPEKTLTRAEAAALLVRMLGFPVEANKSYSFDDTKGSWAEAYINTARRYKLISGTGGNMFAPETPVSRQELAVMFNNYLGYVPSGQQTFFPDVSTEENAWSFDAITALGENGIITGYPDGCFRPEVSISRAEMTALVTRVDQQ